MERLIPKHCYVIEHPVTHAVFALNNHPSASRPRLVAFHDKPSAARFNAMREGLGGGITTTAPAAASQRPMRRQQHDPRVSQVHAPALVRRCALNGLDMLIIGPDASQDLFTWEDMLIGTDDLAFHYEHTLRYY